VANLGAGELGSGTGVLGASGTGVGVVGTSTGSDAIQGTSTSSAHAGVSGVNDSGGYGLWAASDSKTGSVGGVGVYARGATYAGQFYGPVQVNGTGDTDAIVATTSAQDHAALAGHNNGGGYGLWVASDSKTGTVGGVGLYARGTKMAAQFDGSVQCNGDHRCTGTVTVGVDIVLSAAAADCAEDFELGTASESAEPGTVMVLDEYGSLRPSDQSYDRKVAGVISGAGEYRPGMILGRHEDAQNRVPLALVGKVYCRADADYGSINVGDLLTTSDTPGHAMKAADPQRAFGAVIGKALRSLDSGQGLVPILIALQ
jgi:hypothetical protein